jgi:hypothetical protein
MPKPVKKKPAAKKSTTPKRPSSDPNKRVHQQMAEHLERVEKSSPPWKAEPEPTTAPPHGDPFEVQYKARMSELGRKGGKVGGKRRMQTLTPERRTLIALKAARTRWAKRRRSAGGS